MAAAVLLFAAPAVAAYALAYRLAGSALRESLRWAAFHIAWTATVVALATAWRN